MAKDNQKEAITFILLDESILVNGLRVLVSGVDVSQFKRNAVMFYYHADSQLPIGRWVNIRKEKGQLLADAEFDYDDPNEEVQRIIGKVERGFLRMASVDLRDLELSDNAKYLIEGQSEPTVIKSRVREASIVPIGGNHNAFRLYDDSGHEVDPSDTLKLSDLIKTHKQNLNMNKEVLTALKLNDGATAEEIETAVKLILADNKTLKETNATLTETNTTVTADRDALKTELDAIKLADHEAAKALFETELQEAFKDARLDNDAEGKTKARWIKLFDLDAGATLESLQNLPKRQSAAQRLSDGTSTDGGAFANRQKELVEKSKARR